MLAFAVRGVVLLGVLGWYSATVWRTIDGYFKDQFRAYLEEEYRKHPRMRSDVEGVVRAVDKGPGVPSALPTESSRRAVAEISECDDAMSPADIADTCRRATAAGKATAGVTGGSSENSDAGKNALPVSAESRELPGGSDTRNEERLLGAIDQDGDREERDMEESEVGDDVFAVFGKPQHLDEERSCALSDAAGRISRKRSAKRTTRTMARDIDLVDARFGDDNDFSEFEDEGKDRRAPEEGILVSELPFKPKADIGNLDRVTVEEFCPVILEDESSCGETTTWP